MKKIDIAKHVLVPPFTKLTEEEKKAFLTKYNISILQMPKIKEKDPVALSISAKEGDIIKFIRKTRTGTAPYFRAVIK